MRKRFFIAIDLTAPPRLRWQAITQGAGELNRRKLLYVNAVRVTR